MRWAIEAAFGGEKVFMRADGKRVDQTFKDGWYEARDKAYYGLAARPPGWSTAPRSLPRCNVYIYQSRLTFTSTHAYLDTAK